jgi:hypothetical protein
MLVHEFSKYELRQILLPILSLEDMEVCADELCKVIGLNNKAANKIIDGAREFVIRYKGFEIFISDFRWIHPFGASISIQFRKPLEKWHRWFPRSERLEYSVCGTVVEDLKAIFFEACPEAKWGDRQMSGHDPLNSDELAWRCFHLLGDFNYEWVAGQDASPIIINISKNDTYWFIQLCFNPACFTRSGGETTLRDDWATNARRVSEAIEASARRRFTDSDRDANGHLLYEPWCASLIEDFGSAIIDYLPQLWKELQDTKAG